VTIEVETVITQDDYKHLKWTCIRSEPLNWKYSAQWTLYTTTNDNYCLLIQELIFEKDQYMTIEQLESCDKERKDILFGMDNYLNKSVLDLYQLESIIIKTDFEKLWGIVTNWKKFQSIVPFIAEKVEYIGEPTKIGSKLLLKWPSKNVDCHLKLIAVDNEQDSPKRSLFMECFDGTPKAPLQNLSISIFRINQESAFLEFKHTFLEPVKFDVIQNISQDKQKILLQLRDRLENIEI